MKTWSRNAGDTIVSGLIAGGAYSIAAALLGRHDSGSAARALNAPSHVLWGDSAIAERRVTLRHTLPGVVINTGAGLFWAAVMQALFRGAGRHGLSGALLAGSLASGLAWFVDYHLIPHRLSPGLQGPIRPRSLLVVHGLFGIGLGLGAWLMRRR